MCLEAGFAVNDFVNATKKILTRTQPRTFPEGPGPDQSVKNQDLSSKDQDKNLSLRTRKTTAIGRSKCSTTLHNLGSSLRETQKHDAKSHWAGVIVPSLYKLLAYASLSEDGLWSHLAVSAYTADQAILAYPSLTLSITNSDLQTRHKEKL